MRRLLYRLIPLLMASSPSEGEAINISGVVADSAGVPVAGAVVALERAGLSATSGSDGKFSLQGATGISDAAPAAPRAALQSGLLTLELPARVRVAVTAYGVQGEVLERVEREFDAGSHGFQPPGRGTGVRFYLVEAGGYAAVLKGMSLGSDPRAERVLAAASRGALFKAAAGELYDVITATKSGYLKGYLNVSKAETTNVTLKLLKTTSPKFSFFVTGMRGLQALAKSDKGFGGDLRFGETGAGAGLRGADKICATLAEQSMPGAYFKGWRAFLSVTADAYGMQVNAIDRIGPGPWYDRVGRLLAPTLNDLKAQRPKNGDATIQNDLPNETGAFNHYPGPNGEQEDNHHTVTGSDTLGRLKSATATCKDWTTADGSTANGKPSAGFSWPRFTGGGGGGGGFGGGVGCCHWMSTWDVAGCAPGIDIDGKSLGGNPGDNFIGSGGGYGGFYCFALNP
jgi:hypothetical protein